MEANNTAPAEVSFEILAKIKSALTSFGSFKLLAQPVALKGFIRIDFSLLLIKKLLCPRHFITKLLANNELGKKELKKIKKKMFLIFVIIILIFLYFTFVQPFLENY